MSQEADDEVIPEESHEEQSIFSHEELVKLTREAIKNIIESDPIFKGLPVDPTAEEIRAQAAVAQGQAIVLYLDRGPLTKLSVVVPTQDTTVLELKKAVRRHTTMSMKREKVNRKISWKHVWKKYHLGFEGVPLTENNEKIQNYGITNKAVIQYVKKKREKNKIK